MAARIGLLLALFVAAHVHAAVPRHALELRAINHPEEVLQQIPIELQKVNSDPKQQALLYLAQANACRVIANWNCQRGAGESAAVAAELAKDPLLIVRGKIAQGRASIAMQDFLRAEDALNSALLTLEQHPSPALKADVLLGFSSLSFALGEYEPSIKYANQGLDALGREREDKSLHPEDELATRARLLRNLGRAYAQGNESLKAREALIQAQNAAAVMNDPKLLGELHLETARLAHLMKDVITQRLHAESTLALAKRLKNSQLEGQGLEALGIAELDANNAVLAEQHLTQAYNSFLKLGLERDELRVLRRLLPLLIETDIDKERLKQMSGRLLQLGEKVERSDQAKAAADFSARLLAQTKAHENDRLKLENATAKEREQRLEESRRQAIWLAIASVSTMLVLAIGVWQTLRSRAAVQRSEARLRSVTDNLPARVTQMDADFRFVFVNPEVTKALQRSEADLVGQKMSDVLPADNFAAIKPHLDNALRGENVSFEFESSTMAYSRVDLVPDRERSGKVSGVFALQFDISELKRAEHALHQLARTDALTGMNNRRSFDERIVDALARHRRNHSGLCLLSFDIDKFKSINDTLGHAAGDQVIVAFARRLQACLRDVDFAARLGGDEFVVLLENCQTPSNAETVAKKIQHLLLEPIELAGDANEAKKIHASASIGIGFVPPAGDCSVDALSQLSDQALYAAKAAGRNTFRIAEHSAS